MNGESLGDSSWAGKSYSTVVFAGVSSFEKMA